MAEKKISFEKALEKLENIVTDIEEGNVSLDESIKKYTEGMKLIDTCRSILDGAEKKIQLLSKTGSGSLRKAGKLKDGDDE
jgi:exodeoxyribonuclease VII small subunit